MKIVRTTTLLLFLCSTAAFAQKPHPADSVIVESKTVAPLAGPCGSAGLKVRVWITNRDTLANITLPLEQKSLSGKAYASLSRRADCKNLNPSAPFGKLMPEKLKSVVCNFRGYDGRSPDTVLFTMTLGNPQDDEEKLEPSLTRRPLVEIKYDSVFATAGQFALDSSKVLANTIQFVSQKGQMVPVNFVKGIITVQPKK